jgi:hypothetical protein
VPSHFMEVHPCTSYQILKLKHYCKKRVSMIRQIPTLAQSDVYIVCVCVCVCVYIIFLGSD